jgi:hypothetical protein
VYIKICLSSPPLDNKSILITEPSISRNISTKHHNTNLHSLLSKQKFPVINHYQTAKMLAQNILVLLAAQLVASVAVDTSLKPINLEASELQRRSACAAAGVVNGQCGRYYRGTGCNDQIGSIDPGVSLSLLWNALFIKTAKLTYENRKKCQGTCYYSSDPIASLKGVGDGTYGTNCVLYYDDNCQQQVGETGNAITGGGKCYTPPSGKTGHSFKCWRKC